MAPSPVRILFTETAIRSLQAIPKPQRRALVDKLETLCDAGDPTRGAKRLSHELHPLFSLKHSRYRLLYTVDEKTDDAGERVVVVIVRVLFAGPRREGDRKDVYALTRKLFRQGLIDLDDPPAGGA